MKNVILAGSINMDIVVTSAKHPNIGETVIGTNLKYFPGGKGANQAVSSKKLGAKTVMIGKVGVDGFGKELVSFLEKHEIENHISYDPDRPTGTALITISSETSNNTIVVIPGANFQLSESDVEQFPLHKGDILLSQFEIPFSTIRAFFKKGRQIGTLNILNPAPAHLIDENLLGLTDILILNETELEFISGCSINVSDIGTITAAVSKIIIDGLSIIVTVGEAGAVGYFEDKIIQVNGIKVSAVDTTGAGDCFVGAIASQLAIDSSIEDAIKFANVAASICVTRHGAGPSMPSISEVHKVLGEIKTT